VDPHGGSVSELSQGTAPGTLVPLPFMALASAD
jgi:hypothetical protein